MFSWDVTLYDDDMPVADIDVAWFREAADVTIGDVACKLYREGKFNGAFILEAGGFPLVQAVKPSAFHRMFEITYDNRQYILQARSLLTRAFELRYNDRVIGSIVPDNFLTRKMTVDLPEGLPLAVRVFIVWLVILMWKRAAESSS